MPEETSDWDRFCQRVLAESELQKQLRDITDRTLFIQSTMELAASCGYRVVPRDIEMTSRKRRRSWIERNTVV